MTGAIRILDDALVNKIAAGEVIERPASVVKELVENALDAGSETIRVTLRGGGRSLVRVADDGHGMARDDALMSLERHATSKIRDAADLEQVRTLGFRGEALPSIGAVCRFQLTTRTRSADAGTRVRMEGGRMLGVTYAGSAPGTEVDARSLFYNLPVRRKFLRTTSTELGHCVESVVRQALIRPEVDFTVLHDGREVLRAPQARDLAGRARDALPDGAQLLEVEFSDLGVHVHGLIAPPGLHRGTHTGATYLYVNGRFVRDALVNRAISEAYRGLVPRGRHPVVMLHLQLDPARVDANVHPTKVEVRFRDPRDTVGVIAAGLRDALTGHGIHRPRAQVGPMGLQGQGATDQAELPLPAHPDADTRLAQPHPGPTPLVQKVEAHYGRRYTVEGHAHNRPDAHAPEKGLLAADAPPTGFRALRVLGVFADRWILCEAPDALVCIERRQAEQCVLAHRLALELGEGGVASQRLLTPAIVDLAAGLCDAVEAHADVLSALGMAVERFAPNQVALRSVPAVLDDLDPASLVADVAAALVDGEDPYLRGLRAMARHASHREAPRSEHALRSLVAALDEVDDPPPFARLTHDDLANKLER